MRAKIVISIPKKNPTMTDAFEVFYYKKINVKNIREANERIIKVWNTNKKVREEVRTYVRKYFPFLKYLSAHAGIGTSYVNPYRTVGVSIPIYADKVKFNLYHTKVEVIE